MITTMIEYKRALVVWGCYACLLIGAQVWAGIPSRPNTPLTGASKQKSALPTAASNVKGQVGGATNANQKSIGSLGGPSVAPTANSAPLKSDSSVQGVASGTSLSGSKSAAIQK